MDSRQIIPTVKDGMHVLNQKYDICIVGDAHVGISSFLYYYINGRYIDDEQLELAELFTKIVWRGSESSKVTILGGLANEDHYLSYRKQQIKNSNALIFAYRIDDRTSFAILEDICERTFTIRGDKPPFIIVGLMADKEEERQVAYEEGYGLCERLGGIQFHECSAREGFGVDEAFGSIVDAVLSMKDNKVTKKTSRDLVSKITRGKTSRSTSLALNPQKTTPSVASEKKTKDNEETRTNIILSTSTSAALVQKNTNRTYSLPKKEAHEHQGCCVIM